MFRLFPSLTNNFPTILGVRWFNVFVLTATPAVGLLGLFCRPLDRQTLAFSVLYYVFSMLGESTSLSHKVVDLILIRYHRWCVNSSFDVNRSSSFAPGYHRLWSHRSYNASISLQLFLLAGGTSAVQGSCYWWSRSHRSHHRYTDTELDPYDSNRGLLWTHLGWMVFVTDLHSGKADVSDLRNDPLLQFQHRHYFYLLLIFGFVIPTIIPGLMWGDWIGGFCVAACLRLVVAHHVSVVTFLLH